jgi:hypothetical protein
MLLFQDYDSWVWKKRSLLLYRVANRRNHIVIPRDKDEEAGAEDLKTC